MNVTFTDKGPYFAELDAARQSGFTPLVRADIELLTVNEGVTQCTVVSGFHDDRYFYEARIFCGENWAGGRNTSRTDGSEAAKHLIEEISAKCAELGFEFRGGQWQRPE